MPTVNMPNRQNSPWADLAHAVSIGTSLYGVKLESDKLDLLKSQDVVNQEKTRSEANLAQAQADLLNKGGKEGLTKEDIAGLDALGIKGITTKAAAELAIKAKMAEVERLKALQSGQAKPLTPEQAEEAKARAQRLKDQTLIDKENQRLRYAELKAARIAKEQEAALRRKELIDKYQNQDSKLAINELTKKNVDLMTIRNSMKNTLDQLKSSKLSEDAKIVQGENMLKLLNSEVGRDAVGAEESQRLGSFLKFKMFNWKEPGSFIGRDLDKFIDQVGLKIDSMSSTMKTNEEIIKKLKSGTPLSTDLPNQYRGFGVPEQPMVIPKVNPKVKSIPLNVPKPGGRK